MSQYSTFKLQLQDITERERFMRLLEYAERGKVIVGWDDIEPDDSCYDEDADNIFPVYDETDLSGDPWYPLAEALVTIGTFNTWPVDEPQGLCFKAMPNNDDVVLSAASQVSLPLSLIS